MELNFLDDAIEGLTIDLQRDAEDVRVNNELGNVQLFYRKVLLLTASIQYTGHPVFLAELVGIFLSYAPTQGAAQ
jgi:hypothetical protein